MKRLVTMIALSTGLAAGPVMADHGSDKLLSKENVGGALGATVGGFVGSKIGDGDSKPAVTAAGAVGGFILGRHVAHSYDKSPARRTYGRNYDRNNQWRDRGHDRGWNDRDVGSRVHPINRTFVAKTTTNVRSGPSTRFRVSGRLRNHERVHVIGKVRGHNWYLIRDRGRRGFVYAPLLRPYGHYGYNRNQGHDRDYGHGRYSRRDFDKRDGGNRAGW